MKVRWDFFMKPQAIRYVFFILCLSLLIGCGTGTSKVTIEDLPDPLEAGWEGQPVCEVLEENSEIRLLKCSFLPGVGHEEHYHDPHSGYTLTGGIFRITDSNGTRDVNVPTGTTWSNEAITTHQVLNIGETTAVFLIIEYK